MVTTGAPSIITLNSLATTNPESICCAGNIGAGENRSSDFVF
jgi:hypothetical protein